MLVTEKVAKVAQKFHCEKCDYYTSKQNNLDKHYLTVKHKKSQLVTSGDQKNSHNDVNVPNYTCNICTKQYESRNGLWLHKKKCVVKIEEPNCSVNNNNNLIEYLIKENSEFKSLILELVKKDNNTINNNTNCNISNNNSFNLNLFLNEKCKDAINISEFVDNIKMQLIDLENFGHLGYVEGVSRIFIKNLKDLDTCHRPIHCSDLKREVFYIKDDDKWSKENDDKLVLKKAIKQVANKNIKQITEWTNLNPDCKKSDSMKNDQYLKIVMNSMSGGSNEEQFTNISQIVKNVAKEVVIEKS